MWVRQDWRDLGPLRELWKTILMVRIEMRGREGQVMRSIYPIMRPRNGGNDVGAARPHCSDFAD